MITIYCEVCKSHQPVEIEPLQSDALNGDKIWGDILCGTCGFVIATLITDEPGQYEIVKVSDEDAINHP